MILSMSRRHATREKVSMEDANRLEVDWKLEWRRVTKVIIALVYRFFLESSYKRSLCIKVVDMFVVQLRPADSRDQNKYESS